MNHPDDTTILETLVEPTTTCNRTRCFTQPSLYTFCHCYARVTSDSLGIPSTHACTTLSRECANHPDATTIPKPVVKATTTCNRTRCSTQPSLYTPCHSYTRPTMRATWMPWHIVTPAPPLMTHSDFSLTLQRTRDEEAFFEDDAKKGRHDEYTEAEYTDAQAMNGDGGESSEDEDEPIQEPGDVWSILDDHAMIAEQSAESEAKAQRMAEEGVFNRAADPIESIVCFSGDGAGAFSEKLFVDTVVPILGSMHEAALTVMHDKLAKVTAFELALPQTQANKLFRATPAQCAGWHFWKRSDDPESLRKLPAKIATLLGMEIIRLQNLPKGLAVWDAEVQTIIATWFVRSALNNKAFATRWAHLLRCPSVARLSDAECEGWCNPGIELVSVSPGKIVSNFKVTPIISRLDIVVRATHENIAGKRFPFLPMEATVPLKIEQVGIPVELSADKDGFSEGMNVDKPKEKATSYHYKPVVTGKDSETGKPAACKADMHLMLAADSDFQIGNVEWCPVTCLTSIPTRALPTCVCHTHPHWSTSCSLPSFRNALAGFSDGTSVSFLRSTRTVRVCALAMSMHNTTMSHACYSYALLCPWQSESWREYLGPPHGQAVQTPQEGHEDGSYWAHPERDGRGRERAASGMDREERLACGEERQEYEARIALLNPRRTHGEGAYDGRRATCECLPLRCVRRSGSREGSNSDSCVATGCPEMPTCARGMPNGEGSMGEYCERLSPDAARTFPCLPSRGSWNSDRGCVASELDGEGMIGWCCESGLGGVTRTTSGLPWMSERGRRQIANVLSMGGLHDTARGTRTSISLAARVERVRSTAAMHLYARPHIHHVSAAFDTRCGEVWTLSPCLHTNPQASRNMSYIIATHLSTIRSLLLRARRIIRLPGDVSHLSSATCEARTHNNLSPSTRTYINIVGTYVDGTTPHVQPAPRPWYTITPHLKHTDTNPTDPSFLITLLFVSLSSILCVSKLYTIKYIHTQSYDHTQHAASHKNRLITSTRTRVNTSPYSSEIHRLVTILQATHELRPHVARRSVIISCLTSETLKPHTLTLLINLGNNYECYGLQHEWRMATLNARMCIIRYQCRRIREPIRRWERALISVIRMRKQIVHDNSTRQTADHESANTASQPRKRSSWAGPFRLACHGLSFISIRLRTLMRKWICWLNGEAYIPGPVRNRSSKNMHGSSKDPRPLYKPHVNDVRYRFHNVQSIREKIFRRQYLQTARLHCEVLGLAEVNCSDADEMESWAKDWPASGGVYYSTSHYQPNRGSSARGVAIFLASSLGKTNASCIWRDPLGRGIAIRADIHTRPTVIVLFHADCDSDSGQAASYDSLRENVPLIKECDYVWMLDANNVVDVSRDAHNDRGRDTTEGMTRGVTSMLSCAAKWGGESGHLTDAFRQLYPERREFTRSASRHGAVTRRRIDRILVSPRCLRRNATPFVERVTHVWPTDEDMIALQRLGSHSKWSDHAAVQLTMRYSDTPRPPKLWKFPGHVAPISERLRFR